MGFSGCQMNTAETFEMAKRKRYFVIADVKLDDFIAMQEKVYKRALNDDRLYKDLKGKADLSTACASRLGEMFSEGMRLSRLAPDAWAYFQAVHDQKDSE